MNILRKFNTRKFRMSVIKMAITACTIAMAMSNAMITFAANDENATPDNVKTGTMTSLVGVGFWILRGAIIAIGGIPAILKIVQGKADENPRDTQAGYSLAVITGLAFGASFLIEKLI